MDDRSVWAKLLASRKVVLAGVTVALLTIAAIGLTVAAVRGSLTWDSYFDRLEKLATLITAAIMVAIFGVSWEDSSAKRGAPITAATGGGDVKIDVAPQGPTDGGTP